ncbi:MAG: hypothetical protein ACRD5H_17565, partial [Nitrososphaerales archaeon]
PIRVRRLVLAAGTFGTTELILRSRKNFKDLNYEKDPKRPVVGTRLSLNGDAFGFVIDTREPVYITRGPIDTAHVRFKRKMGPNKLMMHSFTIEDATIPRMLAGSFSAAIQRYLVSEYKDDLSAEPAQKKLEHVEHHLDRQFLTLWRIHPVIGFAYEYIKKNSNDVNRFRRAMIKRFFNAWPQRKWGESQYGSNAWLPGTREHDILPKGHTHRALDDLEVDYLLSRTFFFACMGIDSANGVADWDPKRERLDVNWVGLANDPIYKEIRHGMEMLGDLMVKPAKKNGKKERYLVLDPMKELFAQEFYNGKSDEKIGKMFSLHPLGGCPMETYGREGAVTIWGRLLKKKKDGESTRPSSSDRNAQDTDI